MFVASAFLQASCDTLRHCHSPIGDGSTSADLLSKVHMVLRHGVLSWMTEFKNQAQYRQNVI
jgi:hypothetical protein